MALTFNSSIGVFSNWRSFDGSWKFEYTQQYNPNGTPVTDKSKYPAGTIFFDSDVSSFVMSSSVKNVYIDKVPVVVKSSNIQYTSINSILENDNAQNDEEAITPGVHRCTIVFESKTPIDPSNLSIKLNKTEPLTLYEVNRQAKAITSDIPGTVKDISISRNADLYTLTFYVCVDGSKLTDDMLNGIVAEQQVPGKGQIYVTVWNIAANTVTFNTEYTWKTINNKNDIGDVTPLIITFTDPVPENRIVYPPNEGSVKVIVQNPNSELFDIAPTVILEDDSIGVIDDYRYDSITGSATFYVRPINESGYVVVSAWLAVNNTEIDGTLKAKTFATAMDGEWIGATEGRLIKFKQNVPKYLKNDNYASFVQSTEDFFNTVYTSMTNGKHISILEKFARINNFDDIKAMEAPLIDLYRKQYGINVQPNNDDLNFYLRNKQLPPPAEEETQTNSTNRSLRRAADPQDTDTEVLKNYVFRDITGLELNSFIKDIYKNIPYYNQMAGTYRGIKFILNQIGLCVKLVEIWSSREITDNFEHEESFAREDELNAERYNSNLGKLSDIGRYYLTSRFDVDIMDTGLTFREFNELSYNIVKLVLKIKPIHRVLRKLAYVFVENTDIHFQDFLLDKLGGSQEVRNYKYTWNLLDTYAAKKTTDDNGVNHTWTVPDSNYYMNFDGLIRAEKIFFPFNALDAQVKYTWKRYNAYGEDFGVDMATEGVVAKNKYADVFLNKHAYMETPTQKPRFSINGRTEPHELLPNGYAVTSKNAYNNLFSIEEKLKRSFCKKIGINFCYIETRFNQKLRYKPPELWCTVNGTLTRILEDDSVYTINPVDLTMRDPEDQTKIVKLIDVFLGRKPLGDISITSDMWSQKIFDIGTYAGITSETNGFYLNLMGAAQSVLEEVGVGPYFNKSYFDNNETLHTPIALFAQIADFRIALGTDYLIYEDGGLPDIASTYNTRTYVIIGNKNYTPPVFELTWFAAGDDTNYYLLKKNGRRDPAYKDTDWIKVFRRSEKEDENENVVTAHNRTFMYKVNDPLAGSNPQTTTSIYITTEEDCVIDNLPELELDSNNRPIVIFEAAGYDRSFTFSDTDLEENKNITAIFDPSLGPREHGLHFMVVEESRQDGINTIIFRVSDRNDYDYTISNADAEFAISYRQ